MSKDMKDMFGNIVFEGDILLNRGGCFRDKDLNIIHIYNIFEKPHDNDGSGYRYNIKKQKVLYYWCRTRNSIKINNLAIPDLFIHYFKNGMHTIYSKLDNNNALEIINSSDWMKFDIN